MSDNLLLLTEDGNYLTAENGDYLIAVVQYLFTAQNGSYTVAGQTANLLKTRILTAQYGNYALTGQTATLAIYAGYFLLAEKGDYSITGNDATIDYVAQTGGNQYYIELRSFTERRRM